MIGAGAGAPTAPAGAAGTPTLGTIDALQALRAGAALLVVVDHALIAAAQGGLIGPAIAPFAAYLGYLGVYVFFTISGFVMVFSHEGDFGRRDAPARFLARRIARILPLHWITTFAMTAARPENVAPGTLALSLLLVPHQAHGAAFGTPLFNPAWPLQYEMFFYALFAAALLLPRRAGLALLAASLTAAVAASSLGWLGRGNALAYLTEPVLLYFVAGLGLGLLRRRLPDAFRPGFAAALLIAGGALAACAMGALAWGTGPLRVLLLTAAAPVVAAAACGLSRSGGSAVWARRVCRSAGDATYAVYMVHPFIVFPLGTYLARNPLAVPWPLFVLFATALSIAAGVATYRWVERRLVKSLGRLMGHRPGIGGRAL
jgi:peptidoglycan/LPS O-acetylase OafA/YrhL